MWRLLQSLRVRVGTIADSEQTIEYGGVRREIISRNPPLVDEDGYEVESDDDEQRVQDAMAGAAILNPYADIRLERTSFPLSLKAVFRC
jgi:RXT2-like, N-terminal